MPSAPAENIRPEGRPPTYFLVEEVPCPICDGQGTVLHPLWEQFYAENPPSADRWPGDVFAMDWFAGHGIRVQRSSQLPPRGRHVCSTCQGKGRVRRPARLEDALVTLGLLPPTIP